MGLSPASLCTYINPSFVSRITLRSVAQEPRDDLSLRLSLSHSRISTRDNFMDGATFMENFIVHGCVTSSRSGSSLANRGSLFLYLATFSGISLYLVATPRFGNGERLPSGLYGCVLEDTPVYAGIH